MPHRCSSTIWNDNQGASNRSHARNDGNWSESSAGRVNSAGEARALCSVPCSACCTLKHSKQNGHGKLTDFQASSKEIKIFGTNVRGMPKAKSETSATP